MPTLSSLKLFNKMANGFFRKKPNMLENIYNMFRRLKIKLQKICKFKNPILYWPLNGTIGCKIRTDVLRSKNKLDLTISCSLAVRSLRIRIVFRRESRDNQMERRSGLNFGHICIPACICNTQQLRRFINLAEKIY